MNKKGFTLIELLAVILILGIIALIAIPIVNKIIDESKRNSFTSTVNNVVGVIEDACQEEALKGFTLTKEYIFTDGEVYPALNIKGLLPKTGKALVDSNCKVTISVSNGVFAATKDSKNDNVKVVNGTVVVPIYLTYADGTAVYFNPVTGLKCNANEAVSTIETKSGCMKWYIFNDDDIYSDEINLLLDHNIESYATWNSSGNNVDGPNEILAQLQTDTNSWGGVPTRTDTYSLNSGAVNYTIDYSGYKARLITANEIAKISGNTDFDETTSISAEDWFFIQDNSQNYPVMTKGSSEYGWLFDNTDACETNGCNIEDNMTWGYRTATADVGNSGEVWIMFHNGALANWHVDYAGLYGIRPVITIAKSVIK